MPQAYDKKRQEREEKKEKDVKLRPKPTAVIKPKTVGIVPPLVTTFGAGTPTSSKRNLTSRLETAESEAKRKRTRSPERRRGGAVRRNVKRSRQSKGTGKSSPIKIVQLQTTDRDRWGGQRGQSRSPRKRANPKADMESLLLAAGLEVCCFVIETWQLDITRALYARDFLLFILYNNKCMGVLVFSVRKHHVFVFVLQSTPLFLCSGVRSLCPVCLQLFD